MKRLLSMLAAVGLTATAAGSAVACTDTVKAKDVTVDTIDQTATFTKKLKLPKGTTLTADEKNKAILEIIASQLSEESDDKTLLGIIMKPAKEITLDKPITEAEINDALFFVKLADIINDIQQQPGDGNIFRLKNDKEAVVTVIIDISKPIANGDKKVDWSLTDMKQDKDKISITEIKDKVKIDLVDVHEPTLDIESQTTDNKTFFIDTAELADDATVELKDISVAGLPKGIKVIATSLNDTCQLVIELDKPIPQTDKIQDFKLTWMLTSDLKLTSTLVVDPLANK